MNKNYQIRIIGTNGQLSLGKMFAGKTVLVEHIEKDMWVIKSGRFIPDSERWLHQEENRSKVSKALAWCEKNKPKDNFDAFVSKIDHETDQD